MIQSHLIWERIRFVRDHQRRASNRTTKGRISILETTITDNILYNFLRLESTLKPSKVQLWEASNERINGNDLDIYVNDGRQTICYTTQAKLLYSSGIYGAMPHQNKNGYQIELLIKHAKLGRQRIPIYLLYNYSAETSNCNPQICSQNVSVQQLGCSVISAEFLKDNFRKRNPKRHNTKHQNKPIPDRDYWSKVSFEDIHSMHRSTRAVPWANLACCFEKPLSSRLQQLGVPQENLENYEPNDFSSLFEGAGGNLRLPYFDTNETEHMINYQRIRSSAVSENDPPTLFDRESFPRISIDADADIFAPSRILYLDLNPK